MLDSSDGFWKVLEGTDGSAITDLICLSAENSTQAELDCVYIYCICVWHYYKRATVCSLSLKNSHNP